jgi:hypothetical protein
LGIVPACPVPITGAKPSGEKRPLAQSNVALSNPEKTRGRARGASAPPPRPPGIWPLRQLALSRATGCRGRRRAAVKALASSGAAGPPGPMAGLNFVEAERGVSSAVNSTISANGVMPAIVSLEKGNP